MNCPSCHIQEGDYTRGCNACDDRIRAAYADFAALDEADPEEDPRSAPWNYRRVLIALCVVGCIYGLAILGSKHIWAWATGLHT